MRAPSARGPLWLTARRCLRVAALPTLLATGASLLLAAQHGPSLPGLAASPGAATPWLHLPLLIAAGAVAAAALGFWPLFTARRPGRDVVARLQRGPLGGRGAALAGALAALFVLALPLTTVLARVLGAPATAVERFAPEPPPRPWLDGPGQRVVFDAGGAALASLELRPLAAPPVGAFAPARVGIRVDGAPAGEATFAETLDGARIVLPGTAAHTIELVLEGGTVPLAFPRGSVVAVVAGERSGLANGIAAAAVCLVPCFVALAAALLLGTAAGLPTARTVVFVLLFVATVGGIGPADEAVLALMRGHWVLARGTFSDWLPSLAAGSLAMIGGMLLRRGRWR